MNVLKTNQSASLEDLGYESNAVIARKRDCSPESGYQESGSIESEVSQKSRRCRHKLNRETLLVILTVAGVVSGIILGLAIRETEPSENKITLIKFPGEILMRMLKMMVIPIITTSIVTGLANLDMKKSGRMGTHAIVYYLATTTLAVILGIILVTAIHPGRPEQVEDVEGEEVKQVSTLDTYLDLVRNVFPENIIAACFELVQTSLTSKSAEQAAINVTLSNLTELNTTNSSALEVTKKLERKHNPNVLGLITFFVVFGVVLSSIGEEGKPLTKIFQILNTIFMKMIMVVIWYSPVGICSLIAGNVIEIGNFKEIGETLGLYMVTVIGGLLIHGLFVLPLIFFVFTRQNPYKFAYGVLQALLTALGTASSAGTLPVTMRCLENNLGVDTRVTQFVLPIGATMNMDGTALLEGVASITIAQMYNMPLSFGQIVTISVTATVASIGAAAIPSAGLITLILVLTAIGIPTEAVALLWSIDWFLDRLRTCVNVLGDCFGAGIVYYKNKEHLKLVDSKEKFNSKANFRLEEVEEESSNLLQGSSV